MCNDDYPENNKYHRKKKSTNNQRFILFVEFFL